MALTIITDSASDLPEKIRKQFDLFVIPTPVVINEKDYLDGETIHTKEFYQLLDDPSNDIKTYHINPAMFEAAFRPYAIKGDTVIYLCFSTGIAGTYNAASLAKDTVLEEYPDFDLTIVDSRCASAGFGLLVYKLLQLQKRGASKEIILEAAEFYRSHICHIFTVNTLTYLIKGGRLSKGKGMVAQTLDIKPVIRVDENGALSVYRNVHGRKKSLHAMVEYAAEHGADWEHQTVFFCHGEDEESMRQTIAMMKAARPYQDEVVSVVGCAIGAHTGRGVIGICFLDESDEKYRS